MRKRQIEIAPMCGADLDEVIAIEEHAYRSPWARQIFQEELERDWAHLEVLRERAEGKKSRVVGFVNYWLVRDEIHLLNIAVHPERRRHGHARRLLMHVLDFGRKRHCRYLTLEVRRSNRAAIALYQAFGFDTVGVRPNYYVEDREDALVMLLEL